MLTGFIIAAPGLSVAAIPWLIHDSEVGVSNCGFGFHMAWNAIFIIPLIPLVLPFIFIFLLELLLSILFGSNIALRSIGFKEWTAQRLIARMEKDGGLYFAKVEALIIKPAVISSKGADVLKLRSPDQFLNLE